MRTWKLGAAVGAVAVSALLAGCVASTGDSDGGSAAGELTTVRFQPNFVPGGQDSYLYYGLELGYFEDEGINLEIIPGVNAQVAIDDVLAGTVDIARTSAFNIILNASKQRQVVSVGTVWGKSTYSVILPEGEGTDLSDISGKDLLVPGGSPNEGLTKLLLSSNGLDPNSFTAVNVNSSALISTYLAGEGDGLVGSAPAFLPATAEGRPSEAILFADNGLNIPDFSYVVSPGYLNGKPEAVAAFLRAAYKSYQAAMDDPDAAAAAMNKTEPSVPATGYPVAVFEAISEFRCTAEQAGEPYGPHNAEQWAEAASKMLEAGLITTEVDTSTIFTNELFDDGSVDGGTC